MGLSLGETAAFNFFWAFARAHEQHTLVKMMRRLPHRPSPNNAVDLGYARADLEGPLWPE
jgi:hypothetical protein